MHRLLRFRPTDEELAHFLVGKATGAPLPPGLIEECDIYGQEPWKIFDVTSDRTFHVFTTLRKNKSRVLRTAGSGTWKQQHSSEIRDCRGELVGYKKSFTFKGGCGSSVTSGRWIMHEFSMCDKMQCKYVLCTIKYYNDEKKSKEKAIAISDDKLVQFKDGNDGWMDRLMDMEIDPVVYSDYLYCSNLLANPSKGDTNAMLGGPYKQTWDPTSLHQQQRSVC